jgi:hypothetical protein
MYSRLVSGVGLSLGHCRLGRHGSGAGFLPRSTSCGGDAFGGKGHGGGVGGWWDVALSEEIVGCVVMTLRHACSVASVCVAGFSPEFRCGAGSVTSRHRGLSFA